MPKEGDETEGFSDDLSKDKSDISSNILELLVGLSYKDALMQLDQVKEKLVYNSIVTLSS